jgi:hypothetical protein
MIQLFTSYTSYFIAYEAACFGPYMTIIRPSYESSQNLLATRWDPNYVYSLGMFYLVDKYIRFKGCLQSKSSWHFRVFVSHHQISQWSFKGRQLFTSRLDATSQNPQQECCGNLNCGILFKMAVSSSVLSAHFTHAHSPMRNGSGQ